MTAGTRALNSNVTSALAGGGLAGLLAVLAAEISPVIAVAAVAALGVAALALLKPIWGVYLAVLLLPLEAAATAQFANFGITPTEVVLVATAAGWLMRTLAGGGEFPRSPLVPPLLAALAIHIPGIFLAANQFAVFKQFFMWSAMFLLLLCVLADEDRKTTERLAGAIAFAGAAVAAIAIFKSSGNAQFATEAGGVVTNRAVGPFASPVLLGTFVIITVPLQVVFALQGRNLAVKLAGATAVLISITALALALSRSAIVALTAALLFLVIWWKPARMPALIVAALLAALLLSRFNPAPNLVNPDVIGERLSSITSPDTRTAQERFRIWEKAPEIFVDNLPFGIGPKNLPDRAAEYNLLGVAGAPSNAHNTFLIVATELGIFGIVVLIWLVVSLTGVLVRDLRVRAKPERGFAIALAGTFLALAVDGFTGYSYGANAFAIVAFLLAGMAVRIDRQARLGILPEPAAEPEVRMRRGWNPKPAPIGDDPGESQARPGPPLPA